MRTIIACCIAAATAHAQDGWTPTFTEEFDGTGIDTTRWNTSVQHNYNGELQTYVDSALLVQDGFLRVSATMTTSIPYTSGWIDTQGKFSQLYGYFEIRCKMPAGQGFWPAFWLLPEDGSWPPEIDVVEFLGHDPNTVYFTNHWTDSSGAPAFTDPPGFLSGTSDFTGAYHVFAIEWNPLQILWYVDGSLVFFSTQGVPATPMYVIADLAVGGTWPGSPDGTTVFPGEFDIDYIRVFIKPPPAPPTLLRTMRNSTSVTLTWVPVPGALAYNVYQSSTTGVSRISYEKKVEAGLGTSLLIIPDLPEGTSTYFVVTAIGSGGESEESDEVSSDSALPTLPSLPLDPVKRCGLLGLDVLIPLGLFWFLRRTRPGPSPSLRRPC